MKNLQLIFAFLLITALNLTAHPPSPATAKTFTGKDIVASIAPLQSLVANITNGVAEPQLLLPQNASPHTYSLKPSDARKLSAAKIVFWFGPQLENFLAKPIKTLAGKADIVSFLSPDTKEENAHIWLDPAKAKTIVEKIASTLIKADPPNHATYTKNLQATLKRLNELDQKLRKQLNHIPPIFVFHNAYAHLANRYNFHIADVVVNNPSLTAGARQTGKIRQDLIKAHAMCIFSEPQFNPRLLAAITRGTDVKTRSLDPLGSTITPGPDLYFKMMAEMARNIKNCSP